jgi:hypothetical protein
MENAMKMKEKIEKKDVHATRKRPYKAPKLTVHGDVDKITEVLRLTCAKGQTLSRDEL